ncbi:MAG TPA: hypothetical protein VNA12_07080, partial [Mycobacteriales bacterium]|nr:hypothetical protein [Mycobacteriales bacterium]
MEVRVASRPAGSAVVVLGADYSGGQQVAVGVQARRRRHPGRASPRGQPPTTRAPRDRDAGGMAP